MKKACLSILLCALSLPAIAQGTTAREYLSFLPQKDLDSLFASGELTRITGTFADLTLWQKGPFSDKIRAALQGFDSTIAAEGFFLFDPPALSRDDLDLKIFSSFTAFSKLKGL